MELATAIKLIRSGVAQASHPQHWADLGAGDGLFTRALGTLLPPQSSILAIDQQAGSLQSIQWNLESVTLQKEVANFITIDQGKIWDGIVMANALHYVKESETFLGKLKTMLTPSGRMVIVEYERRKPNAWVPYPIDFKLLKSQAARAGFASILKLEEIPSAYDAATLYSAVLIK